MAARVASTSVQALPALGAAFRMAWGASASTSQVCSRASAGACRGLSSAATAAAEEESATGKWLFRAGGVVLFGATAATLASAADDLILYKVNEKAAMELIKAHPLMQDALGEPLTPRPWWNAAVTKSENGQSAQVFFVLDGAKKSSDIYMRVVRFEGSGWTLLYNTLGKAKWEIMFLDAMLPDKLSGSRLPVRIDLLAKKEGEAPKKPKDEVAVAKGPAKKKAWYRFW